MGSLTQAQIDAIKALAFGAGESVWGWDQWNWFAEHALNLPAINPEDRGLTRSEDGGVAINGATTFPFETWYGIAYGGPQTPSDASGTGTGGSPAGLPTTAPSSPGGLGKGTLLLIAAGAAILLMKGR